MPQSFRESPHYPSLLWIIDTHREGRRYIVRSDELMAAFLEPEAGHAHS